VRLTTEKPKPPKYPKRLESLGDQIRKKRLDLGLLQRHVAIQIGVSESSIYNWERNRNSPQVHDMPAIIRFSESFPERLRSFRQLLGLTEKAIAQRLGIDPTTIRQWESGRRKPSRKLLVAFQAFIELTESSQPGMCQTSL
jgi:transcriptional regulator with XRE-family HTH domain